MGFVETTADLRDVVAIGGRAVYGVPLLIVTFRERVRSRPILGRVVFRELTSIAPSRRVRTRQLKIDSKSISRIGEEGGGGGKQGRPKTRRRSRLTFYNNIPNNNGNWFTSTAITSTIG